MTQSAVDYLIEQLQAPCRGIPSHIIEQAKQIEKEQKETLYTKEELEEAMILMANFVKNAIAMPPESKIELTSKSIIQSLKQK